MKFSVKTNCPLSDNSYTARDGKPWQVMMFACSDPRYRTATLKGLADELSIETGEIAPEYMFGGPAILMLADEPVKHHFINDVRMAAQHGVTDIFLVQHTGTCKGLAGRGFTFANGQEEFDQSVSLTQQAVELLRNSVREVNVWGVVLLNSETGKRFKFAWVDEVPPGVGLED